MAPYGPCGGAGARHTLSGQARRLADLPGGNSSLPLATRLQALGNLLEQRRSPLERVAICVLALTRLPLPLEALAAIVQATGMNVGVGDIEPQLDDLVDSEVIRATANGDLLLHPVFRSLYRARLRAGDSQSLRSLHRLLAEYYYDTATGIAFLSKAQS